MCAMPIFSAIMPAQDFYERAVYMIGEMTGAQAD